jgi:hypothetical protein
MGSLGPPRMLTPETPFAQTHGEDHGEYAEEQNKRKRTDKPYALQNGEASPVYIRHEDLIYRSRLKNDYQRNETGSQDHEQQPSKAGNRLRRVLGLKVGIGRSQTHPQRNNTRHHQENRDNRQGHHERRNLKEDVGTHDEDLRKQDQGKIVDGKLDPEKGPKLNGRRPDDPEGVPLEADCRIDEPGGNRGQDEGCEPHIQERKNILQVDRLDL